MNQNKEMNIRLLHEICPTTIIYACSVQIDERTVFADLIVFPMDAFDVILGMDWLSTYRAVIDCIAKTVRFSEEENKEGMLASAGTSLVLPFISCIEAKRLLCKGCCGFLASIVDLNRDVKLNLDDIDVMREFPDVFADDVSGLPSDRDVEFVIDLVLGTVPISKAPYCMAPIEMKELKTQLLDLLDKGFIDRVLRPGELRYYLLKRKTGLCDCALITEKPIR